jgi:hypothetical protein
MSACVTVLTLLYFQIVEEIDYFQTVEEINYMFRPFSGGPSSS